MINLKYKFRRSRIHKSADTVVYALGGGKGGIGKSFITSNLALYLAKCEHKTLLIDLDFGGANAHTYLGVEGRGVSAKNFLLGEISHLGEAVVATKFRNLSIVRGASEWNEDLKINTKSLHQMFQAARNLGFDRIVYDLGAGTGVETVEAFLDADIKLAVSTPEPISIENTYNFLKRVFYRSIQKCAEEHNFQDSIQNIMNRKEELSIKKPSDLLKHLNFKHPQAGAAIVQKILSHKPQILINQCRSPRDQKIGNSLAHISRQYFGQNIEFVGSLDFDNRVWQSIRSMKPLFIDAPDSGTIGDLKALFEKIENKVGLSYTEKAA
jgi:flagellar biosynthesis protein FlhG